MDAIETTTIERDGRTYRITVYHDADVPNPLEDWAEMGTILSLNRRHINFDPDGIEKAIDDPDAVPLSYFEHGRCLWSVAGELLTVARCPWDSVPFAGLWLPGALALASASNYGGRTRRHFMRAQACPPGVRRLHEMVQRRSLWIRGNPDQHLPRLRL